MANNFLYNEFEVTIEEEIKPFLEVRITLINGVKICEVKLDSLEKVTGFATGDYFQETINSDPQREGLGSKMHDFLIEKHKEFDFVLRNVYSTQLYTEKNFSVLAKKFWDSRCRQKKAEFISELNRYRICFDPP